MSAASPCCQPAPTPTPPPVDCCSTKKVDDMLSDEMYHVLEIIARVVLAVFSFYVAPLAFLISLGIGVAIGIAYVIYHGGEVQQSKGLPVCAQGYLELLTGLKFPREINLTVTALFIAMHTWMECTFFVPFVGVTEGIWIGSEITLLGYKYFKKETV